MSTVAWITMAVICGTVWGGFISLWVYAFRREGIKASERNQGAED